MYWDYSGHTDSGNGDTRIILDPSGDSIQVVSPNRTRIIYKNQDEELFNTLLNGGSILTNNSSSSNSSDSNSKKNSKSTGITLYNTDIISSYNIDEYRDIIVYIGAMTTKIAGEIASTAGTSYNKNNVKILLAFNGDMSSLALNQGTGNPGTIDLSKLKPEDVTREIAEWLIANPVNVFATQHPYITQLLTGVNVLGLLYAGGFVMDGDGVYHARQEWSIQSFEYSAFL